MVGHDIWSELVENPFNLQNLYFGIIIILLILIGHFNHTVKMFFNSFWGKIRDLKTT